MLVNNFNNKRKKVIYFGIQILRIILSFNIVVNHCYNKKYQNRLIYVLFIMGISFYVPIFFLISFYFSYKLFNSRNITKLKERLLRISIPYLVWPIIIWYKYSFINILNGVEDSNKYRFLFYQLIIGKPFHPIFWFQFCLLFWSIAFIILIFSFKSTYNIIFSIIILIILCLNYFGFINNIFKNYNSIISRSVKEIFITILYIEIGYFFGSIKILDESILLKLKIIIISILGAFITKTSLNKWKFRIYFIQFVANIVFISFSFSNFEFISFLNKINCFKNITFFIKHLACYSGGIYYLHWEIKHRTFNNLPIIKKGNFSSCIFIYLLCYLLCFFAFKIFKNTKLRYLFI